MTEISRRLFLRVTGSGLVVASSGAALGTAYADPAYAGPATGGPVTEGAATIVVSGGTVTLTNDVLKVVLRRTAGSLTLTSLNNRAAAEEYQTVAAGLFSYELDGEVTVAAGDGGWTFGTAVQSAITMYTRQGNRNVGRQVRIPMTRTGPRPITVTAVFEIYNGRAGLRFHTLIKNGSGTAKLTVTRSTVLALGLADQAHTLHYVPNQIWKSTRGALAPTPADTSSSAKRAELPKKVIAVLDTGHGWSVSPELNWKGMKGHGNVTTDYMLPPYASINAWSEIDHVRITSNPTALQLVLFPNEEFEYLAVNVTVFKGDIVDGRMADEEHFRKRFRYNNTSTVFHTNDWDFRGGPGRELPPDYYYTTIIPKAKAAGFDMVMLDDFWNTTRDSIEPSDAMRKSIHSLAEFSQTLTQQGMWLGLWFSLTGGGHGDGRDLANPVDLAFKKAQIETLITQYKMTHHMIDLTEYWQTQTVTSYSHPSDSAYRKAVLSRRMMNELVQKYPQLLPKMTSELDVWPTQGDRNNGLMHVCDNGWNTANGGVTGEALSLRTALTGFGHLPQGSWYMNIGVMSGKMEDYYSYMAVRAVKFGQDPGNEANWPAPAITLMASFNRWRKSPRVHALTEEPLRPVFLGPGWDTSSWDSSVGPYVWMHTDEGRNTALIVATGSGGRTGGATVDLRWLSPTARYLISDVTLDDSGEHTYAFRGTYTGAALRSFAIDLRATRSRGKAFWVTRAPQNGRQVAYADENVTSWTVSDGTVRIVGRAGTTVSLVIGDPTTNRGLVVTAALNSAGIGRVALPAAAALIPPQPVGDFFAQPLVFQAETLTRTVTPSGVTVSQINEPNASSGTWVLAGFTAVGQRIEYTVDVPADGTYAVEIRYKENASRGRSQATLDGEVLGPVVDHYYPGRVYNNLEFRSRQLGVRSLAKGEHTFGFTAAGTSGASFGVGVDQITLTPTLERDRIIVEAETATVESSVVPSKTLEPAASGGAFQLIPATGVGAYVEYQVTAPRAGRYRLTATTKRTAARGQASLHVDGELLDRVVDFYLPTSAGDYQYLEEDLGFVTFTEAGPKPVRFTVTGRASGSGSYQLAVDALALTPVGQLTVTGPDTVRVGQSVQLTVTAVDIDVYADPKYLLWSVDGADTGGPAWTDASGRITGQRAGTATVRVRSQLDPTVNASTTITVS
jgi:hypothetical protein